MASSCASDRRVVVTGMGIVSCLGTTLDTVSAALQDGRSGIGVVEERTRIGYRSPLSGCLPPLDPSLVLKKKELKSMPEHVIYAALAADSAFRESGTPPELFDSDRAGIIIGSDSSAGAAGTVLRTVETEKTTQGLGSGAVVRVMNSSPSMNLGIKYKMRGGSLTVSAACASGAHALGMSYLMIKMGWTDVMFTGGCQEVCWESMAAFDGLMAFSTRVDAPAQASRPFDRDRDGLVPSGGAAILFLEELSSAKARNAKIYAEMIGYTLTSDGYHLTEPSSTGAMRCMTNALQQAGISASDVDYINAHATATLAGDMAEAKAIHAVFGSNGPPVSSTKSMTGHECWMAGASEAIYSILMMRDGFVAPNVNFTGFSEGMPEINVTPKTLTSKLDIVLSNSFGFGGTNACLLFKRYAE
ncbi:MAG: beta-ketoacyl-[acyl-carrier-protein] synthase family protein [bacterium]